MTSTFARTNSPFGSATTWTSTGRPNRLRHPVHARNRNLGRIDRFRLRRGDVLITKDSEDWTDIGVPAVVELGGAETDILCGYHCALLRPRHGLEGGYLFWLLNSSTGADQFRPRANGVTRYGLSKVAIGSIRLPLPPSPEQAAIVHFLDCLDRRIRRCIRAKEELIALLEEQQHASVEQAITGQIDVRTGRPYATYRDSGVEWLPRVPPAWERYRLKTLLEGIDRRSSTGSETLLSLRRDHGIVVYADHFSRPPQAKSLVDFKLVARGQLVVNRLQANNGLVFRSGLNGLVSPDYSVFRARLGAQFAMRYLSSLLRTIRCRAHFRRESTGLGTGTAGFLRLYDDRFLATAVYLPAKAMQRRILDWTDLKTAKTTERGDHAGRQIALLREYRQRLIDDAVTGKIDVRGAAAALPKLDPVADDPA